jgi:hypothetical protein
MLTVEGNRPGRMDPIRRVAGFPKGLSEEIHRWISQQWLEVNIDVAGTAWGIRIHMWTDRVDEVRYVYPEDYVNHNDPMARRNPSLAASMVGVGEILAGLRLAGADMTGMYRCWNGTSDGKNAS